ncbi:hypothetical protein EJB05_13832, partial [Eragrostis curvula]
MSPPPPPPRRSPAALMDEIVEEIFLRFPPDDPKRLLRCALVRKRWGRIASDPVFRRRFRELHRTAPMLGVFYNFDIYSFFTPTCSFRPPCRNGTVIDARHGRILVHLRSTDWSKPQLDNAFVVWDPLTNGRRKLPLLPRSVRPRDWNAAVLCATAPSGACNHLDCCWGPFLVVLMATDRGRMFSYLYSSEAGVWSEQASAPLPNYSIDLLPSVFVGNALYFLSKYWKTILKCDLGTQKLSVIEMPPSYRFGALMTTEHGELGFVTVVNSKLYLWSREAGSEEDVGWIESRVIELKTLFPAAAFTFFHGAVPSGSLYVVGFAEGADVIFVRRDCELFTLDLNSVRVTKVSNMIEYTLCPIFPIGNGLDMSWTRSGCLKCLINTICSIID